MAHRDASSDLSSPGPDSDRDERSHSTTNTTAGRPLTALSHGENQGTPNRSSVSSSRKNKESPVPDDGPPKKKRVRRTRAQLEADRLAAQLHPELFTGKKNPKPIDSVAVQGPGGVKRESSGGGSVTGNATAASPSIRFSPYAPTAAPQAAPPEPRPQPALAPSRTSDVYMASQAPSANPSPRSTHYDPIRGFSTDDGGRSAAATRPAASPSLNTVAATNRASASPAISSLIDPPQSARYTAAADSHRSPPDQDTVIVASRPLQQLPASHAEYPPNKPSNPPNPPTPAPAFAPSLLAEALVPRPQVAKPQAPAQPTSIAAATNAVDMVVDLDVPANPSVNPNSSRASNSSGASPHQGPTKPKEKKAPLPPLPGSGSGLLTSAMLGIGGGLGTTENGEPKEAPVVCIDIELSKEGNNVINFNMLAEAKYGFNALHPRLAAQKNRLAQVAAAGAMLENEARKAKGLDPDAITDDDMSDDDRGGDSNVEMGGTSGAEGGATRKKRVFKEDNYDKADPFVDDSEMGWEEQRAIATDGFFVFCGPLVDEGQTPQIVNADGTTPAAQPTSGRGRGRGRGRGGGPGSRGGKVAGQTVTNADGQPVPLRGPGSRGGRGSRGGGRGRGRGGNAGAPKEQTLIMHALANPNSGPAASPPQQAQQPQAQSHPAPMHQPGPGPGQQIITVD